MVEEVRLGEVLRMILEAMYRALGFRRVLFCLRDPKSGALVGRFLLGDGDDALRNAFRVATRVVPGLPPDLFTAVCLKGADTLIADATGAAMRARLPAWFVQAIDAPAFLLLPMAVKNAPIGLIYADKAEPGAIVLGEKELSLLAHAAQPGRDGVPAGERAAEAGGGAVSAPPAFGGPPGCCHGRSARRRGSRRRAAGRFRSATELSGPLWFPCASRPRTA
jgi:hypothetical protein